MGETQSTLGGGIGGRAKQQNIFDEAEQKEREGTYKPHTAVAYRRGSPEEELQRRRAAVTLQKYYRGYKQRQRYKEARRRMLIAKELLDTERSYLLNLTTLLTAYRKPFKEAIGKHKIDAEQVKRVFGPLEVLVAVN